MEFDITVKDGVVSVGEQATALLIQARELDLYQKQIAIQLDAFKEALKEAMEANGIKSFENDSVRVTYKAPTTRQTVDTKRLKEEGIYDLYAKTTPVKSSVVVSFKE